MAGISWSPNPSVLGQRLVQRAAEARAAAEEQATRFASQAESAMRQNAPWNDRSGAARGGLRARAEGTTITLESTVPYAGFLENGTSRMRAYPIVHPTAEQIAPEYFAAAIQAMREILG